MLTLVWTILIFCAIIFIHELGHFVAAKLVGVTVHEFSIGMGPKIFGFNKNKTDYSIRILPIGGYVKLEGEDGESDDEGALCNKKPWQKFAVLFAGGFMNFVLGFLIFVFITANSSITSNIIDTTLDGYSMQAVGFMPGDKIVAMEANGKTQKIRSYNDITLFNIKHGEINANITVERNGEKITKYVEVKASEDGRKIFGFSPKILPNTFKNVIVASLDRSVFVVKLVFLSLLWLITGKAKLSEVSGPVGIVSEINTTVSQGSFVGFLSTLSLAGLISINLGVMNLLPLPALDGGRIVFVIIEKIIGHKISADKEGFVHFIGFALLMALMIFVTFSDILKLFT